MSPIATASTVAKLSAIAGAVAGIYALAGYHGDEESNLSSTSKDAEEESDKKHGDFPADVAEPLVVGQSRSEDSILVAGGRTLDPRCQSERQGLHQYAEFQDNTNPGPAHIGRCAPRTELLEERTRSVVSDDETGSDSETVSSDKSHDDRHDTDAVYTPGATKATNDDGDNNIGKSTFFRASAQVI